MKRLLLVISLCALGNAYGMEGEGYSTTPIRGHNKLKRCNSWASPKGKGVTFRGTIFDPNMYQAPTKAELEADTITFNVPLKSPEFKQFQALHSKAFPAEVFPAKSIYNPNESSFSLNLTDIFSSASEESESPLLKKRSPETEEESISFEVLSEGFFTTPVLSGNDNKQNNKVKPFRFKRLKLKKLRKVLFKNKK